MKNEAHARIKINKLLEEAGWRLRLSGYEFLNIIISAGYLRKVYWHKGENTWFHFPGANVGQRPNGAASFLAGSLPLSASRWRSQTIFSRLSQFAILRHHSCVGLKNPPLFSSTSKSVYYTPKAFCYSIKTSRKYFRHVTRSVTWRYSYCTLTKTQFFFVKTIWHFC